MKSYVPDDDDFFLLLTFLEAAILFWTFGPAKQFFTIFLKGRNTIIAILGVLPARDARRGAKVYG